MRRYALALCFVLLFAVANCSPYDDASITSRQYRSCIPDGQRSYGYRACCNGSNPVRAKELGRFKYCVKQEPASTQPPEKTTPPPSCIQDGKRARRGQSCCNGSNPVRAKQLGRFKYCVKQEPASTKPPQKTTLPPTAATKAPSTTLTPTTTTKVQTKATPEPTTTTQAPTTTKAATTKSTAPPNDGCDGLGNIVRKNVKSMSQAEWNNYVKAFNILRETPDPSGSGRSVYEQYAFDHDRLASGANGFHGNEYFLAWHREMLWQWDVALNAAVPGVTQPYFKWSDSADAIFNDPMFRPNRFGGSVATTGAAEAPIPNGPFQGLRSSWSQPHAVTRNFNLDPLADNTLIDSIIQGVDAFPDFTIALEFGVHNAFHRAIGGDMVTPWSPNEPLFYFHHAYIDFLYRRWENRRGSDTSSGVNANRPMVPWSETTTEATQGTAKRCVSYEGLGRSARFAVVDRQSAGKSGVKFETATEKVEALEVVAKKKVADPAGYKATAVRWRKANAAAAEAAVLLRQDLKKLAAAQKIIATLLLKDGVVDMAEVEEVASESVEEVKADGAEELVVLKTGELPDDVSTEDVANVNA